MRRLLHAVPILAGLSLALGGCAGFNASPGGVIYNNPAILPTADRDLLWDTIVDVVDDDFEIQREERPRLVDNLLTEGRLETRPLLAATILEPWRNDSVTADDRWEATLQTIRRRALVRMVPASGGFQVQVTVLKEREILREPQHANTSAATFRNDSSFQRFDTPIDRQPLEQGWIPLGSDPGLEQRILSKLHRQLGL